MPATTQDDHLRSALRISATSVAWTLVASVAAIVIGITGDSLALVAFGFVGVLDCAASLTLIVHFRDARKGGPHERRERLALRLVTAGLFAVGFATAAVSVLHFLQGTTASNSRGSVFLAAGSLVALTLLALRKRHVSVRLSSHALRADSYLSAVGAALAAVTLAGTAASNSVGWWWADPSAAFLIAVGAASVGFAMRREP